MAVCNFYIEMSKIRKIRGANSPEIDSSGGAEAAEVTKKVMAVVLQTVSSEQNELNGKFYSVNLRFL